MIKRMILDFMRVSGVIGRQRIQVQFRSALTREESNRAKLIGGFISDLVKEKLVVMGRFT